MAAAFHRYESRPYNKIPRSRTLHDRKIPPYLEGRKWPCACDNPMSKQHGRNRSCRILPSKLLQQEKIHAGPPHLKTIFVVDSSISIFACTLALASSTRPRTYQGRLVSKIPIEAILQRMHHIPKGIGAEPENHGGKIASKHQGHETVCDTAIRPRKKPETIVYPNGIV